MGKFDLALAILFALMHTEQEISALGPGQEDVIDVKPVGIHMFGNRYDLTGVRMLRAQDAHNPTAQHMTPAVPVEQQIADQKANAPQ